MLISRLSRDWLCDDGHLNIGGSYQGVGGSGNPVVAEEEADSAELVHRNHLGSVSFRLARARMLGHGCIAATYIHILDVCIGGSAEC